MRKYIHKKLGGGSMYSSLYPSPPTYPMSFNGSSVSNNFLGEDVVEKFRNESDRIMGKTDALINSGSAAGNLFSTMLKSERATRKGIRAMNPGSDFKSPGKKGIFSKEKLNNTMSIAGAAADLVGSFIPQKEQSAATTGMNQAYDTASDIAMSLPGIGPAIGGAMKIGGVLSDGLTAIGVGTDQMTGVDKILDSKLLKLPFGLINALGAKRADTITKDNEAFEQVGSSYGGTTDLVDDSVTKSGKKYGLFSGRSRNKANRQIGKAKVQQTAMGNIADEAKTMFDASNNPLLAMGTQLRLDGGYQQANVRTGKTGLKLDREFAQRVVKLAKGKKKEDRGARLEEVVGFKNGGAVNVIPDGALHAHKHHLEAVDDKFDEVTGKGIPVITEENGGDIMQHAEVEKDEIIFNLEVTKQFEKLKEDGSDNAAIEAGKMLVYEILNNTVDNTGLLNKVE